jgi:hypothetical protein
MKVVAFFFPIDRRSRTVTCLPDAAGRRTRNREAASPRRTHPPPRRHVRLGWSPTLLADDIRRFLRPLRRGT